MSLFRLARLFSTGSKRAQSLQNEGVWQKYRRQLKEHPLPIWAGLLVVGYLQFRRIRKREEIEFNDEIKTRSTGVAIYEALPLSGFSRIVGAIAEVELPLWFRKKFFSWYIDKFDCQMCEACYEQAEDYKTWSQFFARTLKEGVRQIDPKATLVVPCDGKVLTCGPVDSYGYIDQVKGISYPLRDFIGPYLESTKPPKNLHQITLYLAPGDYHHFHSPTAWTVTERRHFPGKLLSVGLWAANSVPRLFVQNERAVYLGYWSGGLFSFTAVGATNVGSIKIDFDPELKTNVKLSKSCGCNKFIFPQGVTVDKGQHFGQFNLGSTVVLVFEAPKDFKFTVEPGQKVYLGQSL